MCVQVFATTDKLLRSGEVLAKGEKTLEWVVGEAGGEYQCSLETSCSSRGCGSSTSYLLTNFSRKGDHPESQKYSWLRLTYYKW